MGQCVTANPDGTLTATGEAIEACSGYVLVSGSEWAGIQILLDIFMWPAPEVVSSWFVSAFGFIIVMNVVGHVTGSVVKMVSTERH